MLRPALEAAVVVAREGERASPVEPAPAPLRRYLNFARLPDPALDVARRVLDDDEDFRRRVAGTADEQAVGRGGWLFLHRPEGWEAELDALLQQTAAAELAAKDERHERGAQRRLAGAEAALARAEAAARDHAADAEAAQADLREARAASRELAEEVDRQRAEIERLGRERAEIIRRLKATEATVAQRAADLRAARHEVRMLQAELSQADPSVPGPEDATEDDDAGTPPEPGIARAAVAAVLVEAAGATERLQQTLSVLADLAGLPAPVADAPAGDAGAAQRPPSGRRPPRRQPVALPPATFDDGREAADHLVRVSGILVLVDGYNISNATWHGLAPDDQRTRLLDACGELHARLGTELEVIFDGTGDTTSNRSLVRAAVRYRFTPAGVEADDVILARLDEEPPTRPIVVVSSDRRVRDGARQRGANVLGAKQFLSVLNR